jgi:hypothetical protein
VAASTSTVSQRAALVVRFLYWRAVMKVRTWTR